MSNTRRRRRPGAQVSGNPQRRAQQEQSRTSGPDPDRIRELEEELRIAREAEEVEFDERLEDELDDYEDDVEELPRRPRARQQDQDRPKFVVHNGERYRLPASPDDWSIDALEAFENGKVATAIKGILGLKAWTKIRATLSGGGHVRDLEPLMDQIARAYGFESVGE